MDSNLSFNKGTDRVGCSQCNRPCINYNGRCIIAEYRKLYNLTFKEAWEIITRCDFDNPNHSPIGLKSVEELKFKLHA